MIKSAIFETNVMNMSPKSILLYISLLLVGFTSMAQYTEKINSNRPGTSQGAFSVGNNVLQLESGLGFGKQKHDILKTNTSSFTADYAIRYGLFIEQLEIRVRGRFRTDAVKFTVGGNEEKLNQTNFEINTAGAKYLLYDPYKQPKFVEKDSSELEDLKSWKRTHRLKWKKLIPAVSIYAGINYDLADNPFVPPGIEGISPRAAIATQNNWDTKVAGNWVLVTNLIFDRIATTDMSIGWIITSTHTFNRKWAIFGEFQGQKSDFYSDNIIRFGSAYLMNKNFQLDGNIAFNYKDTPSIFRISAGVSYRFDFHKKDEVIEQPGLEKGIMKDAEDEEGEEGFDFEDKRDGFNLDEFEEIENDTLKQGKTPFSRSFEDEEFRETMEKDLDERRTANRMERERVAAEKVGKKEAKRREKEERRKLKRLQKDARAKEKAQMKAEKEKEKMLEEIDAELDKIEQEEAVDQELIDLEKELKELEFGDSPPPAENTSEPEGINTSTEFSEEELEMSRETLEKEQKEEEKRRKKAEKQRLKDEKKKQKEEEKRRKKEAKEQEELEEQEEEDPIDN